MKKLFPGYYKPSDEEFHDLWDNALFVFDANVLLDLHRFSSNTKKTLLNVITVLDDRLWIPYRAAYEYHKNLNNAINDQLKKYDETINNISELDKLISNSRHPFLVKKGAHKEIKDFCKRKLIQLRKEKKSIEKLLTKNPIKDKLAILLENKVSSCPKKEEIDKICNEGEKRFREKTPPGFEDAGKPGSDRYGDLLMWKEIIEKGKTGRNIILVTNDSKKDWYLSQSGKTLGPHPLLINEFILETSKSFYAYQTKPFLKYFAQHFNKSIGKDVLMEVETNLLIPGPLFFDFSLSPILESTINSGSTKPAA